MASRSPVAPQLRPIVLHVIEHHDGVKVVYDNDHRPEFGIAELGDFATWAGAPARTLVGDAAVETAVQQVVTRQPEGDPGAARSTRLFITQVLSGMERYYRGEVLSASGLIRGEAVEHLLRSVVLRLPGDRDSVDPLDPRRRFELVHTRLASRIEAICRSPAKRGWTGPARPRGRAARGFVGRVPARRG